MIRLLGDKIAVVPIGDPNRTEGKPVYSAKEIEALKASGGFKESGSGSIFIPDEAKERADQGIVKYVGPKVKQIKIGDYVLYSGYTGTTVQFAKDADGVLIIFREPFVTAILDNPDTDVPGLFFHTKQDWNALREEIKSILVTDTGINWQQETLDKIAFRITEMFSFHDSYFTATYEMAMNLIAEAFRNSDFAKRTGFKNPLGDKPQPHEYNIMNDLLEEDEEEASDEVAPLS